MRKIASIVIVFICLAHCALGQTNITWVAGGLLEESKIKEAGIEQCFTIEEISDKVFNRMWLKSFKKDCTTKQSDLRYLKLLHINIDGKPQMGEMVCHKSIARDLVEIFKELYKAKYRIERMVLVDEYGADDESSMAANNTSCFNFRTVSGTKSVSKHGYGLAIDVNPRYNPYVHTKTGKIEPANGKPYAYKRKNTENQAIRFIDSNDLCYKLFVAHGFRWGGTFRTNIDYQHFEKSQSK